MELNRLTAISPVDGRYRNACEGLELYFSEFALIKYRVMVEIEYFIALSQIPLPQLKSYNSKNNQSLKNIYRNFSADDARKVKNIEKTTNHDVKAVEYFVKEQFDKLGLGNFREFVHFGLTSQDINNTAIPMLLKDGIQMAYKPLMDSVLDEMIALADEWKSMPMLARTHGQPASPTMLGKEIHVFIERLYKQKGLLELIPYSAKFGGATGNFNAHAAAFPDIDWIEFANTFVNHTLFLERSQYTTQIDHYDSLAAICDNLKRINTIFIDFCRDVWMYVAMDYFSQKIEQHETGSSTMPHKVNPIDFENAEGNLGIANAAFEHLSAKLPVSRLQRDLTDSTVLRNLGVPVAHSVIAFKSIIKGLGNSL